MDWSHLLGTTFPKRPGYVLRELIGKGENGAVFRADNTELNHFEAFKIIPRRNLAGADTGSDDWQAEFRKANAVNSPVAVKISDVQPWIDPNLGLDAVVFISDFIEGLTLKEWIAEHRRRVTTSFIELFLRHMFDLLDDLNRKGLVHGDMHSRNILIQDQSQSLLGEDWGFRVTDFGVSAATSPAGGLRDDFELLADNLKTLLDNVDYQSGTSREKFLFNFLRDNFLSRHLIETDQTRDPLARNPREMHKRLQSWNDEFAASERPDGPTTLQTPFDYLNCEQFGKSDLLLRTLYSDRFLGLDEIESQNNIVLTGPRGCGKSMVFKSLSLRHRVVTKDDTPESVNYIGVYYRCDDLYFTFPRYRQPNCEWAIDLPIHFLTSTLLAEALESIRMWATRHHEEDWKRSEANLAANLRNVLEMSTPGGPQARKLDDVIAWLNKQRKRAADKHRFQNKSGGSFYGVEVLQRACDSIQRALPFLASRPLVFFIDDYSQPKITEALQESLNRLVMQRSASCYFKLSTESSISFAAKDLDGKRFVESREYHLVNLGERFIRGDKEARVAFIDDVFEKRFDAVPSFTPSSLDQLLGVDNSGSFNETARQIRKRGAPNYWGKHTLCNLCSGDVHYLIDLVQKMIAEAGGIESVCDSANAGKSPPLLPAKVQNKQIRDDAGRFLHVLARTHEDGQRLVEIVTAFGQVAHEYILHRDSRNNAESPPHQASRIEPYEAPILESEAQRLLDGLIRYSVFIPDHRGKSRRGNVVPRLFLRRFLIPHFNLTFSNRDSISLGSDDFQLMLMDPNTFARRWRDKAKTGSSPTGQGNLFHDFGSEDAVTGEGAGSTSNDIGPSVDDDHPAAEKGQ